MKSVSIKRSVIAFLLFFICVLLGIMGDVLLGWDVSDAVILSNVWLAAYFVLESVE
jgi:hypothetical protein